MSEPWLWQAGAAAVGFGAVALLWSRRAHPGTGRLPEATTRPGQLRVLSARELLARPGAHPPLARLAELTGFDCNNWQATVVPLVERYAAFVQRLPASESHHHAHPGGLLAHGLECAELALQTRRGRMLPPGAPPEEINTRRHRWTYGVLVAALLHDIAKPLADQCVTIYGDDPHAGRDWQPLAGAMGACGATHYAVHFIPPAERDYGLHKRLPVVLLQQLVPRTALAWLAEDAALMHELVAYLSGEGTTGPIAELVTTADRESVRHNLASGPRTRFANARAVPLIERLMAALRRVLADGATLPLNRRGAVGWVYNGGLWIAAKTVADEVRHHLDATETRQDGAAGVPTDNTRLFDTWQEYDAIEPNPTTGLAVWNVVVKGADGEPFHKGVLQVLRFRLDRIYPSATTAPPSLSGRVEIASPLEVVASKATIAPIESTATAALDDANLPVAGTHVDTLSALAQVTGSTFESAQSPTPVACAADSPPRQKSSAQDGGQDRLDPADSVSAAVDDAPQDEKPAVPRMRLLVRPGTPVEALKPERQAGMPLAPAESKLPPTPGVPEEPPKPLPQLFMQWVAQGVAEGSLTYNTASSMVHFVAEGMLLVSPKIFQHFEALVQSDTVTDTEGHLVGKTWNEVQNGLAKSAWLFVAQPGNRHAVTYDVLATGKSLGAAVTGFLVLEPERWLSPLPRPNPYLIARNRHAVRTAAKDA